MDYVKLVGLLMQLPDAVKREVALGVATARGDIDKVRGDLSCQITALRVEVMGKNADLDAKVKAALDKLAAEGVDLSKLEEAIGKLGNGSEADDKGADLSDLSKSIGAIGGDDKAGEGGFKAFSETADEGSDKASGDDSKRADLSTLAPRTVDQKPAAPADAGNADGPLPSDPIGAKGITTEAIAAGGLMNAMGNEAANGGGQSPAEAGKTAAAQAKQAGRDEVSAAARAAYVRAVDLVMSPADAFQEANKAALAAGAGVPEAARAASNAAG